MKLILGAVLAALMLGACQAPMKSETTFNPQEVSWASKKGTNSVTGFAVVRTVGGEARTCAGAAVALVPDSTYARERMLQLFGSTSRGSRSVQDRARFEATDPAFMNSAHQTRCDGQGQFSFENLPDGTWYVVTGIAWAANPRMGITEGGSMMARVVTQGNTTTKVALP